MGAAKKSHALYLRQSRVRHRFGDREGRPIPVASSSRFAHDLTKSLKTLLSLPHSFSKNMKNCRVLALCAVLLAHSGTGSETRLVDDELSQCNRNYPLLGNEDYKGLRDFPGPCFVTCLSDGRHPISFSHLLLLDSKPRPPASHASPRASRPHLKPARTVSVTSAKSSQR